MGLNCNMRIRRFMILLLRMLNPDPLGKYPGNLPKIDVLIPVAAKDLYLLERVLINLQLYCRNPIQNIYVVTPDKSKVNIKFESNIKLYSDSEFLNFDLIELKTNHPELFGWCVQQLIKIKLINLTREEYVLWLDSDTLLNRERTFVSGKYILEIISDEFHKPYFLGLNKSLNLQSNAFRFSRVSHHAVVDVKAFQAFQTQYDIKSEFEWRDIILNSLDMKSKNAVENWFIFGKESFSEYELNSLILDKFDVRRKRAYWWNESRSTYSDSTEFIEKGGGY